MSAPKPKYVAYLRVSTDKQGRSGLGLEAQREAVQRFVRDRGGTIIAPEFLEIESGKHSNRPKLHAALKRCRLTGATLVVAKLDRLSRNVAFLMTLRDSGVDFIAADLPQANTMTITVMAAVAQQEREAISERTKAALAAAPARWAQQAKETGKPVTKRLGGLREKAPDIAQYQARAIEAKRMKANAVAEELRETIEAMQAEGLSLNAMAARLTEQGVITSGARKNRKGKLRETQGAWTATAVRRVVARLA
jgi:DNA invertase Pin-like site-specific DNA recombinase